MRALEAFVGSVSLLLVGWFTVPIIGSFAGVQISHSQGFEMGVMFFVGRFALLYVVRLIFSQQKLK